MLSTKRDPVHTGTPMPLIRTPKALMEDVLQVKTLQFEKIHVHDGSNIRTVPACALFEERHGVYEYFASL